MPGQGSPLVPRAPARRLLAAAALAILLTWLTHSAAAAADEVDFRVRLAWGGGAARSWQGTIRVTSGALAEPIPLGLEADTPGSLHAIDEQTLAVYPRFPRGYDGVDLRVIAPRGASLVVEFQPTDGLPLPPIQWPLETLAKVVQQGELDDQGNRIVGQRSPGDRLPVAMGREHLVFAPGEKFEFTVGPRPLDLAPNTSYLLSVTLLTARGASELTSQDREFKTDAASQPELEGIFALTLPPDEGVYDVRVALFPKRITSPLRRGKPIAERQVQVVVVDPAAVGNGKEEPWQTALELDPAQPRWWEKMIRLPSITRIPGLTHQTYGNGQPMTWAHQDRTLVELAPDVWQAYPLSIGDIGRLHMLEVEYPSDVPQSLQISLIEPNAAGHVVPVGLDTGLEVSPPLPGQKGAMRIHRVPFWPQTKSPLVLLANRSSELPAVFGKIRILVGPEKLPAASLKPAELQRMLAVSLDRPFFCENLGAGEVLDPPTGLPRKDWLTFYQGASRLVECLEHSGRNAAMITLAGEGSALFPSPLLEPTAQYDTGLYFESGQDPQKKDVAELLFRLFDRAGMQLIPAVKFVSPLPELESLRRREASLGILPIGPDGRDWLAAHGSRRGIGVHYNPLDPRVQDAMRRVVAEIAQRYGHHPSFGGIAVHLGPESYAVLPDGTYSLDDATIARFSDETKTVVPGEGTQRYAQRARFLQTQGREAWLDWRAGQLASLYQRMEADIARTHAGARLYLHTGELLASRAAKSLLRPALPQLNSAPAALLQLGLDPQRLVGQGTMVMPRPVRVMPSILPERDVWQHWNQSSNLDEAFSRASGGAALFGHEAAPLRLTSFDENSPFGADKTHTWFIPALAPAAGAARERLVHSIAVADTQFAIDAGWLLPLGPDEAQRGIMTVYRRLPAEPFLTAQPRGEGDRTQPVVVRTLVAGGKTYFYAANDSPWPLSLEIEFESPEIFRIVSYHPDKPGTLARQASLAKWTVKLDPWDLVGGELTSARAKVNTWRVSLDEQAETYLRQRLQETRLRASALRNPPPRDVLDNPSFELIQMDGSIPGWTSAAGPGIVAAIDNTQARSGAASLHLASRRTQDAAAPIVWVRSQPLVPPATGRISLVAWLKVADVKQQPRLRLAIEGKLAGKNFYRRANVGLTEEGAAAQPVGKEWSQFRFPLPQLPEGLTELKVGFDLMGEGELWIDDVQIFDLWFEDAEQGELLKMIANADFQLSAGQLGDCQRFVDSYWPRFLEKYVPLPAAGGAGGAADLFGPPGSAPRTSDGQSRRERRKAGDAGEEKPGMMERMRSWWTRPLWR